EGDGGVEVGAGMGSGVDTVGHCEAPPEVDREEAAAQGGTCRSDEDVVRNDTATEEDQNEGSDHLRRAYYWEHESACLSVLLRILDRQHGTHVALTRANRCSFGIRCRSSGFRFCFAPLGVSLTFAGLAVLVPPEDGRDEAENLIKCGNSAVGDLI